MRLFFFIFLLALIYPTASFAALDSSITIKTDPGMLGQTNDPTPLITAEIYTPNGPSSSYTYEMKLDNVVVGYAAQAIDAKRIKLTYTPSSPLSETPDPNVSASHTLIVTVRQGAEDKATKTTHFSVIVKPPFLEGNNLMMNNQSVSPGAVINFVNANIRETITDPYLPITNIGFIVDGAAYPITTQASGATSISMLASFVHLSEGTHTWQISASNSYGKISTKTGSFTVAVLAPAVTTASVPKISKIVGASAKTGFHFNPNIFAKPEGVDITKLELFINGRLKKTNTATANSLSYSFYTSGFKNGLNTWQMIATNNYGKTTVLTGQFKATTSEVISPESYKTSKRTHLVNVPVVVKIRGVRTANHLVICKIGAKVVDTARTNRYGKAVCSFNWNRRSPFLKISSRGALTASTQLLKPAN